MNNRCNITSGYTLIELILVIAIIGILSVVLIPKFLNLSQNARTNSTRFIAATLSSANSENYVARIMIPTSGIRITNCRNAENLLTGGLPSGYTITSRTVAVNATVTCTLRGPSSTTATFLATGIR